MSRHPFYGDARIRSFGVQKIVGQIVRFALIVSSLAISASLFAATSPNAAMRTLNEGLLVEADLKQGTQAIAGRVLIEAGRTEWTTIAESKISKKSKLAAGETQLKLEARATLLEPDVVEVETRITGRSEQNGKLIVRLGERAEMTTSQMESTETAGTTGSEKDSTNPMSVGLKVLRVRYSL